MAWRLPGFRRSREEAWWGSGSRRPPPLVENEGGAQRGGGRIVCGGYCVSQLLSNSLELHLLCCLLDLSFGCWQRWQCDGFAGGLAEKEIQSTADLLVICFILYLKADVEKHWTIFLLGILETEHIMGLRIETRHHISVLAFMMLHIVTLWLYAAVSLIFQGMIFMLYFQFIINESLSLHFLFW